jgi:hypothetical protein
MSKYSNFDPTHFVVEPEETEQITQLNQLLNRENLLSTFLDISGNPVTDLSDPQTLYNLISAFRRRR